MTTDRRPLLAALLGFLYPGVGHLYAGAKRAGVFLMVAIPVLIGPALLVAAIHSPRPLNILALYGGVPGLLILGAVGGARAARKAPRPYDLRRFNRWWIYAGLIVLNAFVIYPASRAVIKQLVGEAVRIPSGAMEPGVLVGDFLFITSDHRPPVSGEIVAFLSVEEPGLMLLKRAVGVGGDTLEMRRGQLFRGGQPVPEPYAASTDPTTEADSRGLQQMRSWQVKFLVGRDSTNYHPTLRDWGPVALPPGTFFDLGDNRDASYDGRYYGFVPAGNILGRPRTIYYSFDPGSYKPLPWLMAARWRRFGMIPQ